MSNPADDTHSPRESSPGGRVDEETIAQYLLEHRDFFVHHPKLLAELMLPHKSGRAVSLVEKQVDILRERNVDMRQRMSQLLQAAEENDRIFDKTRALTLALLDVDSIRALNEALATHVLIEFAADFVCCHVTRTAQSPRLEQTRGFDHIAWHDGALSFSGLLTENRATCTTLRGEELQQIFPNTQHAETGSAALLPLTLTDQLGILCIGSRDPKHFSPDMQTLFVTYIADVLSKIINRMR